MTARRCLALALELALVGGCSDPPPAAGVELSTTTGAATLQTSTGSSSGSSSSSSSSGVVEPGSTSSTGGSSSTGFGSSSTGVAMECGDGRIDPGDVCLPERTEFPMGLGVRDIAVADFNVDGDLDIATLDVDAEPPAVHVRHGDGTGSFDAPTSFDVVPGAFRMTHGDLDLDGDEEIVVVGAELTLLINQAGTLTPVAGELAGLFPDTFNDAVVGRFDTQLGLDLVHTSFTQAYFQRGTVGPSGWQFAEASFVPVADDGSTGIASAAFGFDGDDVQDLVVLGRDDRHANVLLGDGEGGFVLGEEIEVCPFGAGAYKAAIGELNGDGLEDIVVTCISGAWTVMFGEGDARFAEPVETDLETAYRPVIADVNHDGTLDVLVSAAGLGQVVVYANDGDGALDRRRTLAVEGSTWSFAVADLNDDGATDVAVGATGAKDGHVAVFLADP